MSDKKLFDAIGKAILDGKIGDSGAKFAESVQDYFEKRGYITDAQRNALENLLEDWQEHDDDDEEQQMASDMGLR